MSLVGTPLPLLQYGPISTFYYAQSYPWHGLFATGNRTQYSTALALMKPHSPHPR